MTGPGGATIHRRLGTVLGVLLLCLVAAELGLRLLNYYRPSYVFQAEPLLRFRGRPHAPNYDGRLNSRGFNDREFGRPKPRGAYRIAALGDSFVFGVVPYRHNFLTLLEERLTAEGRPVEILNLGIPSTGPEDHVVFLEAEVLELEPDAVLQFIYVGNDFTTLPVMRQRRWTPFLFHLGRFLFGVAPRLEGRLFHGGQLYEDDQPTFDEAAHLELLLRHMAVFDPGWNGFERNLERLLGAVRRAGEFCRQRDSSLAIVLLPAEIQIDRELLSKIALAPKGAARRRHDLTRPNRALRQALELEGVPVLDLLPPFAEAGRAHRLYKPRDTHWNIAGNRLAAERLHAWLVGGEAGLELPPPEPGD